MGKYTEQQQAVFGSSFQIGMRDTGDEELHWRDSDDTTIPKTGTTGMDVNYFSPFKTMRVNPRHLHPSARNRYEDCTHVCRDLKDFSSSPSSRRNHDCFFHSSCANERRLKGVPYATIPDWVMEHLEFDRAAEMNIPFQAKQQHSIHDVDLPLTRVASNESSTCDTRRVECPRRKYIESNVKAVKLVEQEKEEESILGLLEDAFNQPAPWPESTPDEVLEFCRTISFDWPDDVAEFLDQLPNPDIHEDFVIPLPDSIHGCHSGNGRVSDDGNLLCC
eukprot:TRINITY_DN601_c0_g1_i6.p1 TRINITY_DN601_c0_g1~~TRINITY_DN601_c0_g1_i6.p1  ORF type:complete len:276 (+),score=35.41 TRINITY_DN601_c0_g1_i6:446-1273(+)